VAGVHLERLKGLQPSVGEKAVAAFQEAKEEGLGLLVTCGLRTFPEQARLYAQGRTRPGRIVTNAKPGQSYHNFGLAFDFVVVKGDRAIWNQNHRHWKRFVKIAKAHAFEWGGDWSGFPDYPHFQIKGAPSLASLRAKYPHGYRPGGAVVVTRWVRRDQLPLKKGHKDGRKKLVSKLQKRLDIEADGYYGDDTERAVRKWQAVHNRTGEVVPKGSGLVVTGVVNQRTWEALFADTNTP